MHVSIGRSFTVGAIIQEEYVLPSFRSAQLTPSPGDNSSYTSGFYRFQKSRCESFCIVYYDTSKADIYRRRALGKEIVQFARWFVMRRFTEEESANVCN